jgi:hypothetical protein
VRFKSSEALRFLGGLAVAAIVVGLIALRVTSHAPAPPQKPAPEVAAPVRAPVSPPHEVLAACEHGPEGAAQANAASLQALDWAPFKRPETGWEIYAPLIARELHTSCAPQTPGFAAALADWQGGQRLPADGVFSAAVFDRLKTVLELRRPFVLASARGACPAAPAEAELTPSAPSEGYAGKAILLRPAALAAYRRMTAAARAEDPRVAADPRNLTIFSGFRSPASDAARCASQGNCDTVARANCSAHRTGLALDLYVGQAPGFGPDSSAEANRLFISRTPSYLWLVANASRFGFAPYPFEPWHWEWTGEAP